MIWLSTDGHADLLQGEEKEYLSSYGEIININEQQTGDIKPMEAIDEYGKQNNNQLQLKLSQMMGVSTGAYSDVLEGNEKDLLPDYDLIKDIEQEKSNAIESLETISFSGKKNKNQLQLKLTFMVGFSTGAHTELLDGEDQEIYSDDNEIVDSNEDQSDDFEALDEITVSGEKSNNQLQPKSIMQGDALTREMGTTLGETLQNQLGVHNATFGPGVGLPVIRGMSGSRVQVLQGSMGIHDASSVSPDHAVAIEPLLAEEIEIFRGPASFRYGGTALGGAVNVKTGRIPEWRPENNFDGAVETRYDSNTNQNTKVFKIDAGKGPLVIHVDGYDRRSKTVQIPGTPLDETNVLAQFGNLVEFNSDNTPSAVANTDTKSSGVSLGSSLVFNQGFAGIAYNELDNNYGIPAGGVPPHNDDPTITVVTPENLRIDMKQKRWDAEAQLFDVLPRFESLTFKASNINYNHVEVARGIPATTFDSRANEANIELAYNHTDSLQATLGYRWTEQTFGAEGVESFIPPADIAIKSIYLIESLSLDRLNLDFAYRRESSRVSPVQDSIIAAGIPVTLTDHYNKAYSVSAAIEYALTDQLNLRFAMTKAERPPAVQELISIGPHFATRSFVIGNSLLEVEEANNIDIGLSYINSIFDFKVNVFRNRVDNYIYQDNRPFGPTLFFYDIEARQIQASCVQLTQCLSVFGYNQQNAMFYGYESELKFYLPNMFDAETQIGVFSDFVRGYFTEDGAGDVPRLPPARFGATIESTWRSFDFYARWTSALAQKRAGLNETATAGYDRFDLQLSYKPSMDIGDETVLFLKAKNIGDAEIRHSTSFLRNFTPEPGRSIEAGLRWSF